MGPWRIRSCQLALPSVQEERRRWQPMSREQFAQLQRGERLQDHRGRVWFVTAASREQHGQAHVILRSGDLVRRVQEGWADDYMLAEVEEGVAVRQRPAAPAGPRKRLPLIKWVGIGGALVFIGICTMVAVASSSATKDFRAAQRNGRTDQASAAPSAPPQTTTRSAATSAPTLTTTAALPLPVAVSTPAPAAVSACSASVEFPTPGGGSDETVYVSSNVTKSSVTIVVHYKTTNYTFTTTTDGGGNASDTFSIPARATPGYQVNVDVSVGSAHCSTRFTPQ
jgi:hypothetical protein